MLIERCGPSAGDDSTLVCIVQRLLFLQRHLNMAFEPTHFLLLHLSTTESECVVLTLIGPPEAPFMCQRWPV